MMDPRMRQIETWLYAYPSWKRRVKSLQAQLNDYPSVGWFSTVPSFPQGETSDPTYDAVERRWILEEEHIRPLVFWIGLIDNALAVLTDEEMTLVRLKYFEQKNNTIVWEEMYISRRAFFRLRMAVLQRLFEALGGEVALIWKTTAQEMSPASR